MLALAVILMLGLRILFNKLFRVLGSSWFIYTIKILTVVIGQNQFFECLFF